MLRRQMKKIKMKTEKAVKCLLDRRNVAKLLVVTMATTMMQGSSLPVLAGSAFDVASPSNAVILGEGMTASQLADAAEKAVMNGDYFDFTSFAEIAEEKDLEEYASMLEGKAVFQLFKDGADGGKIKASASDAEESYMYSLLCVPEEEYEVYLERIDEAFFYESTEWFEDEEEDDFSGEDDGEPLPPSGPALEMGESSEELRTGGAEENSEELLEASPSEPEEIDNTYYLTGSEEFVFLFVNETEKEINFSINIEGMNIPAMVLPSYDTMKKAYKAEESEEETEEDTPEEQPESSGEEMSQGSSSEGGGSSDSEDGSDAETEKESEKNESESANETEAPQESEGSSESSEEGKEESDGAESENTEDSKAEEGSEAEQEDHLGGIEESGNLETGDNNSSSQSGEESENNDSSDKGSSSDKVPSSGNPEVSVSISRLSMARLMAAAESIEDTETPTEETKAEEETEAVKEPEESKAEEETEAVKKPEETKAEKETEATEQEEETRVEILPEEETEEEIVVPEIQNRQPEDWLISTESDNEVEVTVLKPVMAEPASRGFLMMRPAMFGGSASTAEPKLAGKAVVGGIVMGAEMFLTARVETVPPFDVEFEDSLLNEFDEKGNEWQIVSGSYQNGKAYAGGTTDANAGVFYSEDGAVRFQKNVVSTDTENEFKMYLNVEPQISWEEIVKSTAFIVGRNNRGESYLDQTFEQAWNTVGSNPAALYYNGSGQSTVWIQFVNGSEKLTDEPIPYRHATNNVPNGVVIAVNPFINGGKVFFNTLKHEGGMGGFSDKDTPLTIDVNRMAGGSDNDYAFASKKVDVDGLQDTMDSEYIRLGEIEEQYDGGSATANNETITWNLPQLADLVLDESHSLDPDLVRIVINENGQKTLYRRQAFQLVYNFSLDVAGKGFQSSANEDHLYDTNESVSITYKEKGGDASKTFVPEYSPKVKGLLYNIEFEKVYEDGSGQIPLPGVRFEAVRRYDTEDGKHASEKYPDGFGTENLYWHQKAVTATAISQDDGSVQFSNLPFGEYDIKEADLGDNKNYFGELYRGNAEVCFTNEVTKVSDTCTDHEADDKEKDKNNMLNQFTNPVVNTANAAEITIKKVIGNYDSVPEKLKETEFAITAKDISEGEAVKELSNRTNLNKTYSLGHNKEEVIHLLVPNNGGTIQIAEQLSEDSEFYFEKMTVEDEEYIEEEQPVLVKPGEKLSVVVYNKYKAHSIHLEKEVKGQEPTTENEAPEYQFEITLETKDEEPVSSVQLEKTAADGTVTPSSEPVLENKLTVRLKKDEAVDIVNLPASVTGYTVKEILSEITGTDGTVYMPELASIEASSSMTDAKPTVNVSEKTAENSFNFKKEQTDTVIFINQYQYEGYLKIVKQMVDENGSAVSAEEKLSFIFEIEDAEGRVFYTTVEVLEGGKSGEAVVKVPLSTYKITELSSLRYESKTDSQYVAVGMENLTEETAVELEEDFKNYKSSDRYFSDTSIRVNCISEENIDGKFEQKEAQDTRPDTLLDAVKAVLSSKRESDDENDN